MPAGGEINRDALIESFQKIKEDITRLSRELEEVRRSPPAAALTEEQIKKIVMETVAAIGKKDTFSDRMIKKINRSKKAIIRSRVLELASFSNLSVAEMKEIVVDNEHMCSKATFYRYIDRLKARNMISEMQIQERMVISRI